jgi:predicted Zn-dependent protease
VLADRNNDAIRTLERSLDTNKTDVYTRAILAAAYAEAGRQEDAALESAEVRKIDPRFDTGDFGSLFKKPDLRAKLTSALAKAGL